MQKALSVLSTPAPLLTVQSQLLSMPTTLCPGLIQMPLFLAGPAVGSGQTQCPVTTVYNMCCDWGPDTAPHLLCERLSRDGKSG